MYDTNKLATRSDWSPSWANHLAAEEGLVPEEAHWAVIDCLRERFRAQGHGWTARILTRELAKEFEDLGGRC